MEHRRVAGPPGQFGQVDEGDAGPVHVVDDPPGYALEGVGEPGGRQGFPGSRTLAEGPLTIPLTGELVVGRGAGKPLVTV